MSRTCPPTPPEAAVTRVQQLEAAAEQAYDLMYDAHSPSEATGHYSSAKDALYDAIGAARAAGDAATAGRLSKRLAHIKAVFRSQFT